MNPQCILFTSVCVLMCLCYTIKYNSGSYQNRQVWGVMKDAISIKANSAQH